MAVSFFIKCKTSQKAQTSEVGAFLNAFNKSLQTGNTDSVLVYFDAGGQRQAYRRMANLLMGKQEFNGTGEPLAAIQLDMDGAVINITKDGAALARIQANFSHDSIAGKKSWLALTIHKVKQHYKISKIDARKFLGDYSVYENLVKSKVLSPKELYSPETLAAFNTAAILRKTYDTVVWFAHVDKKTYFYVAKGEFSLNGSAETRDSIPPANMGLVNPDLKEVIPPRYDLIHSISGTFPGLVEVEKGGKTGFYDLGGKIVLPVSYDQVFPLENDENLAVLRSGSDYYYLRKDMSVSEKTNLKVADFFEKIKDLSSPVNLYKKGLAVIAEHNSLEREGAVYISPSYLVDLNFAPLYIDFKNPLRKGEDDDYVHLDYNMKKAEKIRGDNWFTATFYSIRDYFLGGRSEFYDRKNLVITDKRNDRTYTHTLYTSYVEFDGDAAIEPVCDVNTVRMINDSLFEIKAAAGFSFTLYDSTKDVVTGPYYHYIAVKNNKLTELNNDRYFSFTKYVKMDDSYLQGCYVILAGNGAYNTRKKQVLDHVTPEMLRFMKNEIFAGYNYRFKDKRWQDVFSYKQTFDDNGNVKAGIANVDDSLTVIDKYNINWIDQRLNGGKAAKNTIAAR